MVVLNRIYTRTGDDGTTALGSGERRPKYDLRVSAYGTVDETNAVIGIVRLHLRDSREQASRAVQTIWAFIALSDFVADRNSGFLFPLSREYPA